MKRAFLVFGLIGVTFQWASAADRASEFAQLESEYKVAEQGFFEIPISADSTTAEKIQRFEAWPAWEFIPRVLELAEAQPDDETSFKCCMWICDRARSIGTRDQRMFDADQRAWHLLTAHHTDRAGLPMMCLKAAEYDGPAREQFLRQLVAREDLSRTNKGFATIALAEMLAKRFESCGNPQGDEVAAPRDEFAEYLASKESPEASKNMVPANAEKYKAESTKLFHEVLAQFADVPVLISAPGFRSLKSLGEKATKSFHALERLSMGSELPNISGKDLNSTPLDLRDYRGKVVVISVWFTGCGPCMGMVPQEQRLVETYRGEPFALLGVCCDESTETGQKTVQELGMNWPCWFDGQNGLIARDLNVLHYPTIYVLDKHGVIAAKDLRGELLDAKVAQLMRAE
ncbi:MAG: TlpA disulfide reductase family protein [Pirellulales bacterium]